MPSIITDLTPLESRELHAKGKSLASAFEKLASTYSTDHLEETKDTYRRRNRRNYGYGMKYGSTAFKLARGAMHVKNRLDKPSQPVQNMWKRFAKASKAKQEFIAVCSAHKIAFNIEVENVITTVFTLFEEHGEWINAQGVVEGRRVFEALESARKEAEGLKLI